MRIIITICLTAILPVLMHSQNLIGDSEEMQIILKNIETFSKHVVASDYAQVGAAYTDDAKIFPTNTDIITGTEAIIEYWTPGNGSKISYHKITPEEIKINGDEAYDYGRYAGTSVNPDGQTSDWKGKYVIIWKKIDGDWKIYLDIWNRIQD